MTRRLGYCTNVHAGVTLEQTMANLQRHAVAVRGQVVPNGTLGIGLWLSARAARDAIDGDRVGLLRDFLVDRGLRVFTINGFPYGDFHQDVVKHAVYEPTWFDPARVRYTEDLATILAGLVDDGDEGSISTLPIAWSGTPADAGPGRRAVADTHLVAITEYLDRLAERTGRLIHLDLEPEPGCVIGSAADVGTWLDPLLDASDEAGGARLRRHLRICHDVCHAAVMHDDQAAAFAAWAARGLRIGKVQVSSAVRVDLDPLDDRGRRVALERLGGFREPRYLHQTTVRDARGVHFYEDLPLALAARDATAGGEWRVHFHVPIDVASFGPLGTTQDAIGVCLDLLRAEPVHHFEIETYAWDVLPENHATTLAEGIAGEFRWLRQLAGPGYFP